MFLFWSLCFVFLLPERPQALWLAVIGVASVALIFHKGLNAIVITFVVLLSVVVCFNLLMGFAVTLYPINCRAGPTSFIVMCGRLGSTVGAFAIGITLDNACNEMFYAYAATLTSKPNGLDRLMMIIDG